MRRLYRVARPVPAVVPPLLPEADRGDTAGQRPQIHVGAPGALADAGAARGGEICPWLTGDERRIAYTMSDLRFSWEQD